MSTFRKSHNPNKSPIETRIFLRQSTLAEIALWSALRTSCPQPRRQALCYCTIPPPEQPSRERASLLLASAQVLTVPDDADGRSHPTPTSSHFGKKRFPFPAVLCLRLLSPVAVFSLLQTRFQKPPVLLVVNEGPRYPEGTAKHRDVRSSVQIPLQYQTVRCHFF